MFVRGVGRPDLGGNAEAWSRTLFHTLRERLAALPEDTVVLPAHFASIDEIGPDGIVAGRLGQLRHDVPELRMTEAAFVTAMGATSTPAPAAYGEIVRANLGAAAVDEDKATEWELGKNQCAASTHPAGA